MVIVIRAASFLLSGVSALWHRLRGHDVSTMRHFGRIDAIYCAECNTFLWVRE